MNWESVSTISPRSISVPTAIISAFIAFSLRSF
jgi:hypothetical protein